MNFEINIVVCQFQRFAVPNLPFWYFLHHRDIKEQKLCCERACETNKYLVNKKTYWRKNNYHFEGLHKTTCYKTKVIISQFPYFHWLLYGCLFSFLVKAFLKSERLIRFHHQVFGICRNGENLKPMEKWLDNNNILMYSTRNEGKSVIAEKFIKTLKSKILKKWQLMIANLS